jgi:phage regulator Rha-like protein
MSKAIKYTVINFPKNIIRDIEVQLTEVLGEIALLKFEQCYTNSNNRKFKCYGLPKIEALILVSGYDAKLRASIIYRLDELEKKNLQTLENQTTTQTISYDDYLKAISEAHEAKLELSNVKHQITKEKLNNVRKELKMRKREIFDIE